jgi:hypothetical protein
MSSEQELGAALLLALTVGAQAATSKASQTAWNSHRLIVPVVALLSSLWMLRSTRVLH